jgi:hypothetical protein
MKLKILFLAFWLSAGFLWGQGLQKFTPNKQAYLAEVKEFLDEENKLDEEEELQPLIDSFALVFNTPDFTEQEAQWMYKISNNYTRKRITDFKSWYHFFKVVAYFELNEAPGATTPFLEDLFQLSKRPSRESVQYLRAMYQVTYQNILFDDDRLRWEVFGIAPTYSFKETPTFTFTDADLLGFYKNDSTLIELTSLIYRPRQGQVKGQGGNAYFTRAGLPADSARVELQTYTLDVTKADFRADSATMFAKIYFDEPVLGQYEEKLTSQSGRSKDAVFPRFKSYSTQLQVDNLLPHALFKGGFTLVGSRFYGSGGDSTKATLEFSYKDTLLVRAKSDRFLLSSQKVYSEEVETTLYLKKDSIYHPKLTLRYLPELAKFSLIRKEEGMGSAPFTNSFHNVDMLFDVLNWDIGSPLIDLGNLNIGGGEKPVIFESANYFRESRFNQIQGMNRRNPILHLKDLSDANNNRREFTTEEVARHMRMDQSNAHIFLMNMAVGGFVDYGVDRRQALLKDKIFNYYLNKRKIRDFDVIQFVSKVEKGNNAQMSLEDFKMQVEGIKAIALSDSQKVGLFPYQEKITLKENLDFDFNGRIAAGRFNYWGQDFKFSYDAFMIAMTDIDSMRFKVLSFKPNNEGRKYLVTCKTVLQDLTGEILIDKPNNKSGKVVYSEYPIFRSAKDSYIYYDKPSTYGGVYNREEFFVQLEPFEIDSLDNTSTTGLNFAGTFTSANIFPELNQNITVQPDYSLGFKTETPPTGLSAYGGKGTFTSTLQLSNRGLKGNGRIDYLNSLATSDEFVFFPDSTNGIAENYEIDEKTGGNGNPHVVNSGVKLHWEPYQDVLYTTSQKSPFAMYDAVGMQGTGTLAHSPSALKGKGLMQFLNAETRSTEYTFNHRKFDAPELAFRVKANPTASWGFEVQRAKGEVDFDREKGFFELLDPADYFSFLANEYICFMDYAQWNIPQKSLKVKKQGATALSEMVSVKPQQDSLRFMAEYARFYLENDLLEGFKIPEIPVADALIYPDTGYVAIDTAARMRTLKNAAIMASVENQYHQLYGGTLRIQSATSFTGSADYEYLDQDGTPWPIFFKELRVDTGTTVGFAQIKESDGFFMSPYFAYYGNVRLKANRKELLFRGYTHIDSECEAISTNWFNFKSLIDPNNILIELPEVDPEDKTKTLANGVFLAADTVSGYAAFLSSEVSPADKQMFFANGVLFYDEAESGYVVTTPERIKNKNAPDNYLRLNNLDCTMYGEGLMSLGDNKSQMELSSYGTITYDLETDAMQLEVVMSLNFYFSSKIQDRMAQLVYDYGEGQGTNLAANPFRVLVNHSLSADDKQDFYQEIADYGAPEKLPKELESTLLFGKVTLNWTTESRSFLSEGPIALTAIGDELVNNQVSGFFEIQRKRRGDEIYMVLDIDRSTYVYIEYKRNIMGVYSSDEALMNIIKGLDLDARRNEEDGKPPFTYTISTRGKMNRFIRRFDKFEDAIND